MNKTVILIGFMGSGKTSTGKELAVMLNIPFLDTDEIIEKEQNRSINDIFAAEGEAYFRKLEQTLIQRLLKEETKGVLSVGGGLPVFSGNAEILKKMGSVVLLNAQKETLIKRLQSDATRPLLADGSLEQKIESLMQARAQIYRETADFVVETDGCTPKEAAQKILQFINVINE